MAQEGSWTFNPCILMLNLTFNTTIVSNICTRLKLFEPKKTFHTIFHVQTCCIALVEVATNPNWKLFIWLVVWTLVTRNHQQALTLLQLDVRVCSLLSTQWRVWRGERAEQTSVSGVKGAASSPQSRCPEVRAERKEKQTIICGLVTWSGRWYT